MPIKIKRWNEPAGPEDGFRLLICRYRPRGVRKEDEVWDTWDPSLGPSKALHADFYGKQGPPITFFEYRQRYLAEMEARQGAIDELARRSAGGETITLLCSSACEDEKRCHRTLLKALIERGELRVERG